MTGGVYAVLGVGMLTSIYRLIINGFGFWLETCFHVVRSYKILFLLKFVTILVTMAVTLQTLSKSLYIGVPLP